MILDTREWIDLPFAERIKRRRRILLDGVEQHQVWYVDTEDSDPKNHFIRTYDVLGDGMWHTMTDLQRRGIEIKEDWDNIDGIASKTLFGAVTMKDYDAKP